MRYAVILAYEIVRDFYFRRLRTRLNTLRDEMGRLPLWDAEGGGEGGIRVRKEEKKKNTKINV